MKKIVTLTFILLSACAFFINQKSEKTSAQENIRENESLDYSKQIIDDFSGEFNSSNWYISHRVWGESSTYDRYNGGVIPENVYHDSNEGVVSFVARGNEYAKNEVNGVGTIKDGSLTGGAIISKFTVTPGRYEIRMKVAPNLGICNAFWLYTEDESSRNHELDFELPGWNIENKLSYNQIVCSSWLGEDKHEKTDAAVINNAADGEYHTFIFDWYYSTNNKCVDYYYDGVKIASHYNNIPFYENRVWIGAWIPNNANFVGSPDFEMSVMDVDYFSYTPFKNQTYTKNTPYVSSSQVANENEFPLKGAVEINNKFPNGDFEYLGKREQNYGKSGINYIGNYEFVFDNSYGYYLHLIDGSAYSNIDTILPKQNYSFNAIYKGEGSIDVEFYNMHDQLICTKTQELTHKDNMTYSGDIVFESPYDTYYAVVKLNGKNIYFDDIVFEKYQSQTNIESGDYYYTNLVNNKNIETCNGFAFNQTLNFDGNINHPWIVSSYEKLSRDNIMRFGFYSEEANASSLKEASISNYKGNDKLSLTYSQLYNNSIQFNDPATFYTQAIVMDYDIEDFKDISFHFLSILECTNWQPFMIHYSIDSGNTWKYLTHQFGKNLSGQNTNELNAFTLKASSSDIKENYEHIRFAFTLTSYGNVNSQLLFMGGIVINNYYSFKNFINGNTCSLEQEQLDLIDVIFASLSSDELSASKKEFLDNYANQTYFDSYHEIINRYNQSNVKNYFNDNDLSELLVLLIVPVIMLFMFVLIKNKKGKKQND